MENSRPSPMSGRLNMKICEIEQENSKLKQEIIELKQWKENVGIIVNPDAQERLNRLEEWKRSVECFLADNLGYQPQDFDSQKHLETSEGVSVENDPQTSGNSSRLVEAEDSEIPSTSLVQQAEISSPRKARPIRFNCSPSPSPAKSANAQTPRTSDTQQNLESSESVSTSQVQQARVSSPRKARAGPNSATCTPSPAKSDNAKTPRTSSTPAKRKIEVIEEEASSSSDIQSPKKVKSDLPIKKRIGPKSFLDAMRKKEEEEEEEEVSLSQRSTASSTTLDDKTPCDICYSCDPEPNNEMIFCDDCGVCVHQACYGVFEIPEGEWKCQSCVVGVKKGEAVCRFCPKKGGAMIKVLAPTASQKITWAHVSCVWWIPEVTIRDPKKMDMVIGVQNIERLRWSLKCYLCEQGKGNTCCIQCKTGNCKKSFHVTCGFKHGVDMKMIDDGGEFPQFLSHCEKHGYQASQPKKKKKTSESNSN